MAKKADRKKEWEDARRRHRLSPAQMRMAQALGMTPDSLRKLDNHRQQKWKLPLADFIESRYLSRFGRLLTDEDAASSPQPGPARQPTTQTPPDRTDIDRERSGIRDGSTLDFLLDDVDESNDFRRSDGALEAARIAVRARRVGTLGYNPARQD